MFLGEWWVACERCALTASGSAWLSHWKADERRVVVSGESAAGVRSACVKHLHGFHDKISVGSRVVKLQRVLCCLRRRAGLLDSAETCRSSWVLEIRVYGLSIEGVWAL